MRSFDSIVPIILAAGDSLRMGFPKALLPFENSTFIERILNTTHAVGLAKPIVILGKAAGVIEPEIRHYAVAVCINPDPDRGQLSSIQLGIASLDAAAQAGMLWPVDQPAVSVDLVRRLAESFVASECTMAFPKYRGRRGHPAILHRSVFQKFLGVSPEEGAKKLILRHLHEILELPTEESGVIEDIDTPSDYEALTGESISAALRRSKAPLP